MKRIPLRIPINTRFTRAYDIPIIFLSVRGTREVTAYQVYGGNNYRIILHTIVHVSCLGYYVLIMKMFILIYIEYVN